MPIIDKLTIYWHCKIRGFLIVPIMFCLSAFQIIGSAHFKNKVAVSVFLSAVVAEFIMIFGYFLFEIPLYGIGVAIADIIGNSIQGAIGAVSSSLLYIFVYKTGILKKFFNFKR